MPLRLLLAPNSFKGTFSSVRVAAIWEAALRADGFETLARPLSDGGDGALDVWEALLREARGAAAMRVWFVARDPLGTPRRVATLWLREARAGFVETALASGLALVPERVRDPLRATTYGSGQLLMGLLELGATEVSLGLGGSATVDGGLGLARALGYRFHGAGGAEIEAAGDLTDLEAIEAPARRPWEGARVRALCDVRSPLLGSAGAVRVFAPQKFAPGARPGPHELERLEAGLARLAERVQADLGGDLDTRQPGSGAAGGLGAGLAAFAGATLESGAEHFLRAARISEVLAASNGEAIDGVLTGEGSYDSQSGEGKATGELAALCERRGIPLAVIAGSASAGDGGGRETAGTMVLTGAAVGAPAALDEHALAALALEAARRIGVARPKHGS